LILLFFSAWCVTYYDTSEQMNQFPHPLRTITSLHMAAMSKQPSPNTNTV